MLKTLKLPASGEIGIAAMIVAIIALMILPLPPLIIDILLAVNISISVTLLMITLYVPTVLSLSSFPALLLFTTLYRLSLNIASTKSILLHAEAGHIIDSFGELVVGGNLVVGLVVFAIITTVQFIVIAKGSERVAEVGARFTLDAMPGKQMSIDADLRANLLTGEQARLKRATLAIESQLNGSMDGAMKFVKGDAIAGLIITTINIVAGIAVGVAYHGMSASEAASRFSVLSVVATVVRRRGRHDHARDRRAEQQIHLAWRRNRPAVGFEHARLVFRRHPASCVRCRAGFSNATVPAHLRNARVHRLAAQP